MFLLRDFDVDLVAFSEDHWVMLPRYRQSHVQGAQCKTQRTDEGCGNNTSDSLREMLKIAMTVPDSESAG